MTPPGGPARSRQRARGTPAGGAALITGGAGFIGTNVAAALAAEGRDVIVLDTLARDGVHANATWLRLTWPRRVRIVVADVRDGAAVARLLDGVDEVYHFAAQVAVTTSLDDPLADFDVNARGTLTLLEALRSRRAPPRVLFTSTNKVYGALEDVPLVLGPTRYVPRDAALASHGVDESRPLAFHSPYGCSKGAADQYVLDYARTFGIPAAVFRMSCIYGPHQHGTEDQGWVAHFLLQARAGRPITIYGDGRQVRDVLFVDDLVAAMLAVQASMPALAGRAFNIGGGPARTISLLELLDQLEQLLRTRLEYRLQPWRAADQRYYVSDARRFSAATGWAPRHDVIDGLTRLNAWFDRRDTVPTGAAARRAAS